MEGFNSFPEAGWSLSLKFKTCSATSSIDSHRPLGAMYLLTVIDGGASLRHGREQLIPKMNYILGFLDRTMIPEPYELFDIDKSSDKLFLIGTAWIVFFLFLL